MRGRCPDIVDDCPKEIAIVEQPELPLEYFNPRSVAVIGASSDPKKRGYVVMHNLLQFPGQLYPVNNKRGDVQGLKACQSVRDIPAPADMAVVTVPANFVPKVVEECGQKGVPIVVIITAGFEEMGEHGKALEERIMAIAKGYGTRVIGPNCLDLIVPPRGLDATYIHEPPRPGNTAFIFPVGCDHQHGRGLVARR